MTKRRCCVIRHGALGDSIVASACLPYLHKDGYIIDFLTNARGQDILKHNPRINKLLHFEDNMVPLEYLGNYYDAVAEDYDMTVVLTQSIEALYLHAFPSEAYYWTLPKRRKRCDVNYYEETIRAAGYEPIKGRATGELYFSKDDILFSRGIRHQYKDNFLIIWALAGSALHKSYLYFEPVARAILRHIPEAVIFATGQIQEVSLTFRHPRLIPMALYYPKQTFMSACSLTKVADLVLGPETGLLNAAGCFDTPKMVFLTHSSKTNLTKTWTNDYSLQSMTACSPCHILHNTKHIWERICPLDKVLWADVEAKAPACVGEGFPPGMVFKKIMNIYETHKKGRMV